MKIAFLTPGTGSYYCGACMRDNALVNELNKKGHEALMLPMYLPHMLDESSVGQSEAAPVFFGGINIYLQEKLPLFRRTPNWFDRLLNSKALLRSVAKRSHMTSAEDHGAMTYSMLRLEKAQFRKELEKLYSWIDDHFKPDIFCLSTAMQVAFAREIKERYNVPVVCYFQGEDSFLDSLPDTYRDRCWHEMSERATDSDLLLAPSSAYARNMEARLNLKEGQIISLPNGINLEGYSKENKKMDTPVIGYLARMCEMKGLHLLVEAFIHLRKNVSEKRCVLKIAGAMTPGDLPLVKSLKKQLEEEGLTADVEWLPNISREEKLDFLNEISLFSVPVQYEEAFGLYAVEALAAGVPIVQPNKASFPEIVEATGGGVCVEPDNAEALAETWSTLLDDQDRMDTLSENARKGVRENYSVDVMTKNLLNVIESLVGSGERENG